MSLLDDIEDILVALQVKQSKYKYDFIIERTFNQKTKQIWKKNTIVKYHKEKLLDQLTGEVKTKKVQDKKVSGTQSSIVQWLAEELHILGVDSS